jgi:hypothetical protein
MGGSMGSARNVIEDGNEFGGTVEGGIFEEGVGKEVETTTFCIGGGCDGRSAGNKEVNGISCAAKDKRDTGSVVTGSNRTGRGRFAHGGRRRWLRSARLWSHVMIVWCLLK